jgi:RHS repeat-associated protein
VVTKQDGAVKARYDYLPFGEEIESGIGGRGGVSGYGGADSTRQKFTQKERDNESGLDYFGARYYSSALGRFTGVDPIFVSPRRLLDPQQLNLYTYTRNNPLKFIDPDGRYFVGTDRKRVEVTVKDGRITVGQNASKDLQRMAGLISESGSKTAVSMFHKVAGNDTKVNFGIVTEKVDNGLGGLHQAHDKDGKALNWVEGDKGTGHFEGNVAFIKDKNAYQEATITIYEGNLSGGDQQSTEDAMVSTFAHEGDHDTNQKSIKAIKDRQEGRKNDRNVEAPAYKVGSKVDQEIEKNREKKRQ